MTISIFDSSTLTFSLISSLKDYSYLTDSHVDTQLTFATLIAQTKMLLVLSFELSFFHHWLYIYPHH